LWPIREVTPKKLYFLKEVDCGMLQQKEKLEYLVYFCQHQLGEVLILDEVADVIVKNKKNYRMDSHN
jgi:hypothetical protein